MAGTLMSAVGGLYAVQPWDMAFTVAAAIGGAVSVLLACIRYSTRIRH